MGWMLGWASSWSWVQVVAGLVNLPAFSHRHRSGELSSTSSTSSPNTTDSKEPGQFSRSHTLGLRSPAFTPRGPPLLCCPGEGRDPLSGLLHLVRCRASSTVLVTPSSALLPVAGSKGDIFTLPLPSQGIPEMGQG